MFAAIFTIFLVYFLVLIHKKRHSISTFLHVRKVCQEEFKKITGPPAVPIFGTTWYFPRDPTEFVHKTSAWTHDYGSAPGNNGLVKFWMGPVPVMTIVKGDVAKLIFDSSENISKSSQYSKLKEWIGDGLLISTNDKWRARRKMLTQTFHFAVLKEYQKVFGAQGKVLVEVMKSRADGFHVFDIFPYVKRCALDIICETAMGCSIHAQTGGNDEYVNSVRRLSELLILYEKNPQYWISPIWYLSGYGFEFDRLVKLTTNFTRNVIENRRNDLSRKPSISIPSGDYEPKKAPRQAFLDFLINADELSDEDIREEVDTFMFEGHDTTSSAITLTIWFLGQNPEYQQKVQDELDEIFGEDFERLPETEDFQQMKYLEQCIKETLRITPPVPLVSRRLTEDVKIDHPTKSHILLPAGMTVMLNIIGIMKDARHFEKPWEFNPDHFDPERITQREAFAYVPFSAGPRNCIGQKFALLEEKAVLSWIFRHFSVTSMSKFPDEFPIPEVILKPKNGTNVILRNRRKL